MDIFSQDELNDILHSRKDNNVKALNGCWEQNEIKH